MPLTKDGYIPRLIDARIRESLTLFGAVCVEGPKWCGKTWSSLNQAESVYYVGDPANNFQAREIAGLDPSVTLAGDCPHLIDEWQEVPAIWDAVRFEVDKSTRKGRFLLSGSATPTRKGVLHSGTGRIHTLAMHPITLLESGDSSGEVSLSRIFDGKIQATKARSIGLEGICDLIIRGGWPGNLGVPAEKVGIIPRSYIKQVANQDANRVDGKRRDPHKVALLLRSLARNESTLASNATLMRDIAEFDDESIGEGTIADYLSVLRRCFVVWEQPAFNPNVRSALRVGKSPKRHLADPSLAAAALRLTKKRLMADLKTLGFLFEALCERDLLVYAESTGGSLFHYRDGIGREVDAVVEAEDGRWAAVEIKLGASQADDAARKLIKFKGTIAREPNAKVPSALLVVCGLGEYAYTRPDGVSVVPITSLAP